MTADGWKKSKDDANDEGDETQTNIVEAFVDAAVVVRLATAVRLEVVEVEVRVRRVVCCHVHTIRRGCSYWPPSLRLGYERP